MRSLNKFATSNMFAFYTSELSITGPIMLYVVFIHTWIKISTISLKNHIPQILITVFLHRFNTFLLQ